MSLGKTLGIGAAIYIVLNFALMLLFVALGGVQIIDYSTGESVAVDIGTFFSDYVTQDIVGFIALIFSPGGKQIDPLSAVLMFLADLGADEVDQMFPIGASIVGILWALLPGLVISILVGLKFSEEEPKTAFLGIFLAILICTIIPMLLSAAGLIELYADDGTYTLSVHLLPGAYMPLASDNLFPVVEWAALDYIAVAIAAVFVSLIWAGIAAVCAASK